MRSKILEPVWQILHRQQLAAIDPGDLVLFRCAAVQQHELLTALDHPLHAARRDFPIPVARVGFIGERVGRMIGRGGPLMSIRHRRLPRHFDASFNDQS
jgi:hypothetical protein